VDTPLNPNPTLPQALYRNTVLNRNHVVNFLAIVHSLVHSVALATSLQVRDQA
jgi:hypothetical protein